jgi:hypothetical protein
MSLYQNLANIYFIYGTNADGTGGVFTEEQNELIESSAEMLHGLIHARYILTSKGLAAMVILSFNLV